MPGPAGEGLVGRDGEAAALRAIVRRAVGRSRLTAAVVEGAAGMGASALVELAVAEARAHDATVMRARGDPVQRDTPAGVAVAAGWIDRGGNAADVVAAIATHAERAPVLVVVEHLQHTDAVTIAGLSQAIARLADQPIAVVMTVRPGPTAAAQLIADVIDTGGPHLRLAPLDEPAWVALAERQLGGVTCGPLLRRVLAQADGVPLMVLEVVDALQRDGRIAIADGVADVTSEDLPASLRDRLLHYLDAVPRATLAVLQVAAAMGPVVELSELALVLGRPVSDVVNDLSVADVRALIRQQGNLAWFRHELLAEALHASITPAVRVALHAEIASAFATAGKAPVHVARHLLAAEGTAPASVAADVAWALRRLAPLLALDVARAALDAGVSDPRARDRLIAASLWPTLLRGGLVEVETAARQLLARPHDPALDAEVTWCLVAALQRQGRPAEGREELVRATERTDLDPADRTWLRARLPLAHSLTGDVAAAEATADALLADPDVRDDPDIGAGARATLVAGRLGRGDVIDAIRIGGELERWLRERPPSSAEGLGAIRSLALIEADRFDDARAALRAAARADAGRGDASVVSAYDVWLVVIDALGGAWDDAVAAGDAVWNAVQGDGGAAIAVLYALALPAAVLVRRDELDRADALVRVAEAALEAHGPQSGADVVLWARALVHEARGATRDAAELLALGWDLTGAMRYLLSWRSIAPDLVRLSLAVGDRDRARAVTEDAEEGAHRAAVVRSAHGAALRCRGLLDNDPAVLVAAVEQLRAGPRRPDTAAAAEDAGAALAAIGRRVEAVAFLQEARTLALDLGARRDVRRIESRLSSLGAVPRRVGREREGSGWDSLTARESEVVALAAEGLSNPQIAERLLISRHTVESHLKRIYLKLGVASRAQLAAEALRRRA